MTHLISITDLIKMAEESSVDYVATSTSKCSFGIVNSINGKRLSFSKALSQNIDLANKVCILMVPEQHKLLISNEPLSDRSSIASVNGKDKKICYSAELVAIITQAFKLDFSEKTSMSFNTIDFDTVNGVKVAVVTLGNAEPSYEENN